MHRKFSVCLLMAAGALMLTGVLLLSGCVSKKIEPEYIPRVATSDNGQGVITLSWLTKVGYTYQIFIRDDAGQVWKPLKDTRSYPGTGEMVYVELQHDPRKPTPWYSVRAKRTDVR